MGRTPLSLMEKDSRLAKHIAELYNEKTGEKIHFGQILDKIAIIGESCDSVAGKITMLLGNKIKIVHATFGNAVRLYIAQGRTNYRIQAMRKNNPYRKQGSGRKTNEQKSKTDTVYCHNCQIKYNDHVEPTLNEGAETISLSIYKCKKCGKRGTCSITYYSPYQKQHVVAEMKDSIIKEIKQEVISPIKQIEKVAAS